VTWGSSAQEEAVTGFFCYFSSKCCPFLSSDSQDKRVSSGQ
jgi:hypothetical protein